MPLIIRALDVLMMVLGGFIALSLRQQIELPIPMPEDLRAYYSLMAAAVVVFLVLSKEVYRSWRGTALPAMLGKIAGTWLMVIGLLLLWLFITKSSDDFSRLWFGLWALVGTLLLWLERLFVYAVLKILRLRGYNHKQVALIGKGSAAERLESRLKNAGWTGFEITQRLAEPSTEALETLALLPLDEIWLAFPLGDPDTLQRVLHGLRHTSASIRFAPDWFTFRLINHGVTTILGVPMLDLSATPLSGTHQLLKALEDRLLSTLILVAISPILLLIAIGVKWSSPGPIFYRQERVGLNNQPFMMLKFRSMPVDTDQKGIAWGGSKDKVHTRFGRFIRKTSLDELPQFFNVLKGDMSIVGPRPERPQFVEQFKEEIPDYMRKHLVKAGITGWAQVNGWRGDTDLEARIEHDLYYIENWSLWFDLRIMALTVVRGFVNQNAY